jgi:AcrR family transcriptional regulator
LKTELFEEMGRPREFEIEKAIETATKLFWRHGYEGTSLSDLTSSIGITPPSFYFAFGNKEGLFKVVIERYFAVHRDRTEAACREPTARAVAAQLLYGYADVLTNTGHAPGCLAMNSALPCASGDPIRNWLKNLREHLRVRLRDRFVDARAGGDLPPDADPDALARLAVTVAWGMAVEAQSGASRADLHRTVAAALTAWPPASKVSAIRKSPARSGRKRSAPASGRKSRP